MNPDVVCIGAVTLDLVAAVNEPLGEDGRVIASDAVLASGGPAATAAVTLARLGITTAFVGSVGNDEAGALVRRALSREKVDASEVRVIEGRTAMSPIVVNRATAHRSIAAYYGTVGAPYLSERAIDMCRSAEWVHVDHVGYAAVPMLAARGIRTRVSVDGGNPTPGLDLRLIALYSPTEERILERYEGTDLRAAMRAALDEGAESVVVTRGPAGSVALSEDPRWATEPDCVVEAPSFEVTINSTLGAGDVFHGALLAAAIRRRDLFESLLIANAVASLSCRALDGRSAIPGWDEALDFIEERRRPRATGVGPNASVHRP